MATIKQLEAIFKDVFDDEGLIICADTTASDIDEWDSLSHIRLILQIEQRFSVRFNASEIEKLENVGQMVELLRAREVND